jgi:hypothetical protein
MATRKTTTKSAKKRAPAADIPRESFPIARGPNPHGLDQMLASAHGIKSGHARTAVAEEPLAEATAPSETAPSAREE